MTDKEIHTAAGKVVDAPESGETRNGKRYCTFSIETGEGDGRINLKLYTVRYRDEAMRLSIGDDVTVRYIEGDGHNDLVGGVVLNGEENLLRNVHSCVLDLSRRMNAVLDNQVRIMSRIGEIQKRVDAISAAGEGL